MTGCPTIPRFPQDVQSRFASMREFDAKWRTYANDFCAAVPDPFDSGPLEQRVAALEAALALLQAEIVQLRQTVSVLLAPGTGAIQWVVVNATPYVVAQHNLGLRVVTSTLAIQILLPKASGYSGESIYLKDDSGNASANNITVTPYGTDTIDDDSSLLIDANYAGVELKSNGTGWEIV